MNLPQDIQDALKRLEHAIETSAPHVQAQPPSEAQQLTDLRTANAMLRERLREQEVLVAQERARADRAERLNQDDVSAELDEYKATHAHLVRDRKRLQTTCVYLASKLASVDTKRLSLRAALAQLVEAVTNAGSHFPSDLPAAMRAARAALEEHNENT